MRALRDVFVVTAALALITGWTCGCSKKEPPAPVRAVEVPPPAEQAAVQEPPAPPAAAVAEPVKPKEPAPPKEPAHITYKSMPGTLGYLPAVMSAYQNSKVTLAVAELTSEIQQFYGLKERYPESLKELEEWRTRPLPALMPRLAYDYNPKTGELQVVETPPQE